MSPYLLLAVAGIVFAGVFYIFSVKREGYSLTLPLFAAVFSLIGLFVGARLFGALAARLYYINSGEVIPAGFVFYGGLFGYLAVFLAMQKAAFGNTSSVLCDSMAVSIPLFHVFGRIGCFFAGCCHGFVLKIPVQLAESGFNLILFAVLFCFLIKNKFKGSLLGIYLSSYAAARFIFEFFRTDAERGMIGIFSFAQACSIAVIALVLIRHAMMRRHKF